MYDPADFIYWWQKLPANRTVGKYNLCLGYYKVHLAQIRLVETIKFMSSAGMMCNRFGEFMLTREEFEQLLNFEQMMEE